MPSWIKKIKKAGLTGSDVHKLDKKPVSEMGGVMVLLSFIIGTILYVAVRIFVYKSNQNITFILAMLTAVLIAGIIGIIDDVLGWKIGLRQYQKPLLTLLVAAPIVAVDAGTRIMHFPFFGAVDLGIIYPLIIIPILILFGTNSFNMIAGYNGLEAGQGIIILGAISIISYLQGVSWVSVIALCMIASLLGFWIYNRYPSKIFPGDTLTYSVGALSATLMIFADLEKFFLILFIPYFIEFLLKLRGKFQKESFSNIKDNNTLSLRYDKIYGLEHLAIFVLNKIKFKATEKKVVYSIHGLQLVFVFLALVI